MKFEYCSRFRNRNLYPHCGQFEIKIQQKANDRLTAMDPVCLSCPVFSWKGGFTLNGTVTNSSVVNEKYSEFFVSIPGLAIQYKFLNFLAGCTLSLPTQNLRIISSTFIKNDILKLNCYPNVNITVGQAIVITDYTDFNLLSVRAPTNFDFGKYKYLFNETLNKYLTITHCDLETRELYFVESVAAGWLPTHNLNIRNELPCLITTISSVTTNSIIVLPVALDPNNLGFWIRIRLADYETIDQTTSWSRQIVEINNNSITLFPPLSVLPIIGSTVEILPFSYDNQHPMQDYDMYRGGEFNVSLESLSIPNVPITNGNLTCEPYLYVKLYNRDALYSLKNFINSNNINEADSMWCVKLDPISLQNKNLRFIPTNVQQSAQRMVIDIKKSQIFEIKLQNGKFFIPIQSDTIMPQETWADLNVSAIFHFEEVK